MPHEEAQSSVLGVQYPKEKLLLLEKAVAGREGME